MKLREYFATNWRLMLVVTVIILICVFTIILADSIDRAQSQQAHATQVAGWQALTTFDNALNLLPKCRSVLYANNFIVFIASASDPQFGRAMRVLPDGSNLCVMPHPSDAFRFESLGADGRGAVVLDSPTPRSYVYFFSGDYHEIYSAIEVTPTLISPNGEQRVVIRDGGLFIESTTSNQSIQVDLPPEVTGVLMAQWVANAAGTPTASGN